ncbi:hypothetical protein [Marilutibacter maris]|uniref:hypothetical protein n=1 Tax=Marilutibacter maris TaxID=1605891 RepID=UPI0011AE2C66|nr:hypothetical protein [Lysobacter maris]
MSGTTTVASMADDHASAPWQRHLVPGLVERLRRRATVIPTALGERIWRRIDYFRTRSQPLGTGLAGRMRAAGGIVEEAPIVHVSWRVSAAGPSSAGPVRSSGATAMVPVIRVPPQPEPERASATIASTAPERSRTRRLPVVVSHPQSPAANNASVGDAMPALRRVPIESGREDEAAAAPTSLGRAGAPVSAATEAPVPASTTVLSVPAGGHRARSRRGIQAGEMVTAQPQPQQRAATDAGADGEPRVGAGTVVVPPLRNTRTRVRSAPADAVQSSAGGRPGAGLSAPMRNVVGRPADAGRGPTDNPVAKSDTGGSSPVSTPHIAVAPASPLPAQPAPTLAGAGASRRDPWVAGDASDVLRPVLHSRPVYPPGGVGAERGGTVSSSSSAASPVGLRPTAPRAGHARATVAAVPATAVGFQPGRNPSSTLPHAGYTDPAASRSAAIDADSSDAVAAFMSSPSPSPLPATDDAGQTPGVSVPRPEPRAPVDIDQLARKVERHIMKRLAVDAERQGGWS